MTEVHMTARQRAKIVELLADESKPERLGACSIAAEADYLVVKFDRRDVVCIDANGRII